MSENKNETSMLDYLSAAMEGMGFDGGTLTVVIGLIVALCVGLVIFKIMSFIVTTVLTLVVVAALGIFMLGGSDVNLKNWAELRNNTSDMLLVGTENGCKIYQANDELFEGVEISGWKSYLGACNKAKEVINGLVDDKGYQKIARTAKDFPDCPMMLATSRSQVYLEMLLPMKSKSCDIQDSFKETVLRLNDEKKNGNKMLTDMKEKILDFIVK